MAKKNNYKVSLIEPKYFLTTLAGTVDNKNINDADFRELLRTSLPIVNWPDREGYAEKLKNNNG